MITKNCKYCHQDFRVGNYREESASCCSRNCFDSFRHDQLRKNTCGHCGITFIKENNPQREYKFCSMDCHKKSIIEQTNDNRVCEYCEDYFIVKQSCPQKYCSKECADRGKDRGKTSEAIRLRRSLEYRLWRTAVFERDDYTCVFCDQRGGKLNADHIKRFSDYPELRFAIDNGRTLCEECHRKTDTYGNRKLAIVEA